MKKWEILEGDVRKVLKTLPDKKAHCMVTSPPYYGMRDYGTDPQIWGGNPDCNHEWGCGINIKKDGGVQKDEDGYGASRRVDAQSYFCNKCRAWKGELGLEPTPDMFVEHLVDIFKEAGRVLRDDGVLWVNIGDGYSDGKDLKPMDLMGIPWMFAFAMRDAGWYLRSDTIWGKGTSFCDKYSGSCGTESVNGWRWERHRVKINKDDEELSECPGCKKCDPNDGYVLRKGSWRPTKGHEYMFMFTKSENYFCDIEAIREPYNFDRDPESVYMGSNKYIDESYAIYDKNQTRNVKGNKRWAHSGRNIRTVWLINPDPYPNIHCACVDEETEILTMVGWKNHASLSMEDKIATFNIMDDTIHYHKPYSINKYDYDGDMYFIENRWVSQCITPNHRVLLKYVHNKAKGVKSKKKDREDKMWRYIDAQDIRGHSGILIPNGGNYDGNLTTGSIYHAELIGWILSEGHINKRTGSICIYQSKSANPDKVERIRYVLEKTNQKFSYYERIRKYKNRDSIEASFRLNKTINDNTWIFDWIYTDQKLKKPKWKLLHLKSDELIALFNAIIDGDGHRRGDGRVCLIQKDLYFHEWFRVLCCHIGKRTNLSRRRWGEYRDHATYVTHSNKCQIHQKNFKECYNKVEYKGIVWCPSLPNTNFIARRNNRIFITGNTFPEKLVEPCIKSGTSEKGCCSKCGSPWVRVIEKGEPDEEWKKKCGADSNGDYKGKAKKDYASSMAENPSDVKARILNNMTERITTDWWPSCDCGEKNPVPCTVMDIFSGSGTTGVAAIKNNRNYIGIELNKEYAEESRRRIRSTPGSMSMRLEDFDEN